MKFKSLTISLTVCLLISSCSTATPITTVDSTNTTSTIENQATTEEKSTADPSQDSDVKSSPKNPTTEKLLAISNKADSDADFRTQLINDPVSVLTKEGVELKLTDKEKLKVLDLNDKSLYLILDDRNLSKFYPALVNRQSETETDMQKQLRTIREKALNDSEFKGKLLSDTSQTLIEQGISADLAKIYRVQDYEVDTHFILLLPPDAGDSRTIYELVIRPIISILKSILISTFGEAFATAIKAVGDVPGSVVDVVHGGVEATCFFPRIFGQSCGASKDEIKQYIFDNLDSISNGTL